MICWAIYFVRRLAVLFIKFEWKANESFRYRDMEGFDDFIRFMASLGFFKIGVTLNPTCV